MQDLLASERRAVLHAERAQLSGRDGARDLERLTVDAEHQLLDMERSLVVELCAALTRESQSADVDSQILDVERAAAGALDREMNTVDRATLAGEGVERDDDASRRPRERVAEVQGSANARASERSGCQCPVRVEPSIGERERELRGLEVFAREVPGARRQREGGPQKGARLGVEGEGEIRRFERDVEIEREFAVPHPHLASAQRDLAESDPGNQGASVFGERLVLGAAVGKVPTTVTAAHELDPGAFDRYELDQRRVLAEESPGIDLRAEELHRRQALPPHVDRHVAQRQLRDEGASDRADRHIGTEVPRQELLERDAQRLARPVRTSLGGASLRALFGCLRVRSDERRGEQDEQKESDESDAGTHQNACPIEM